MAGTGIAARHGILIKNAEVLALAHRISTVISDKTGTLTEGKAYLVETVAVGIVRNLVLQLAASLQQGSEHPLAKAVLEKAGRLKIDPLPALAVKAIPGRGLSGRVDNLDLVLGSSRWVSELGADLAGLAAHAKNLENQGYSISWLATSAPQTIVLGMMAFGDKLRPNAYPAIKQLQALNLHTVLLSGDNRGSARAVGQALGIRDVGDGDGDGDGINDAPALSIAATRRSAFDGIGFWGNKR